MYARALLPFLMLWQFCTGQVLYNPQSLYDGPGGLFDPDSLRTVSISFYNSNYDSILHAGWQAGSGVRLPATVQLDNGISLDSVAVRYKGNSTYFVPRTLGNPKLPLNLDMNDLVGGQKLMGYKKLKLANSILDPTYSKELAALNIYRRYLPTPQGNFMKVNLQGSYMGLYVNTEAVNKQFLQKHFSEKDGVLFKCDPVQVFGQPGPVGNSDLVYLGNDTTLYYDHYELKSDHGWNELYSLIHTLEFNPAQIDSVLNVDRVLWAFAVNMVIANLDVYNGIYQHNYYLYRTGDGLFQMIPWDLTESFVGALIGHHPEKDSMYHYDPYHGYECYWYPLITEIIADPSSVYRKVYTAHLRTVIGESLDSAAIKNHVTSMQALGAAAASADPNKFWGMLAYFYNVDNEFNAFGFSTAGITSTVVKRRSFLLAHPEIIKLPPDIIDVQLVDIQGTKYVTAEVANEDSVQLRVTTSPYNSKFKNFTMYDDGTNGDVAAGDNIYTVALPHQGTGLEVKYYVRAFNADAVMLNPERAEYEFYQYTPTTGFGQQQANSALIRVYPNPVRSFITVECETPYPQPYEIVSVLGRRLRSGILQGRTVIDLSALPANVYYLRTASQAVKVMKAD